MDRKIRWGVLGTATIAKNHTLPGMSEAENCELYAIAGRNPEKVQKFQKEFGFKRTYLSYEELLEDPDIEAVYIPLPNHMHKEWIIKAAKKKKHILCEKPLAPTPEEVEEVVKICREEKVLLMEAFAYLHSPIVNKTVELIQQKAIGDPVLIETTFFVKKWNENNIRMRKETFGGCTYDLGCYNISLILRMMNEMPCEVEAMAHYMENRVDDYSSIFLKFPNGAYASAVCGMCSGQRADRYLVHGTKGTLEACIPYNAKGTLRFKIIKERTEEETVMEVPSNYRLEVEQFGRCIDGTEQPWVSNDFSLKVAKVLGEVLEKLEY